MMKTLNDLLGRVLLPALTSTVTTVLSNEVDELKPELLALLDRKFDEWMPKVLEVVVSGMAHTASALGGKATDVIPGDVDDRILDPIFEKVAEQFPNLLGGLLGGRGR